MNVHCPGHGKCELSGAKNETFFCRCDLGWTGPLCAVRKTKPCELAQQRLGLMSAKVCLHDGICIDNPICVDFTCELIDGWSGKRCDKHFTQVSENLHPKHHYMALIPCIPSPNPTYTHICNSIYSAFANSCPMHTAHRSWHIFKMKFIWRYDMELCFTLELI